MKPPVRHLFVLCAALTVAYLNSFRGEFQFDDYNVIVLSRAVHSFSGWLQDLPHGIRPLLKFTYMICWVAEPGPIWFHLLNLLIHGANTLLVYLLTKAFLTRNGETAGIGGNAALIAALIFALHPVQTEAVTYVSGRSTSLMTAFYLASLGAYVAGTFASRPLLTFIVSPLLFAAALLTKETAVTLPFALLLWDMTGREEVRWPAILRRQSAHWAMAVAGLVFLIGHSGHGDLLERSFSIRGVGDNILTQVHGVTYLMSKLGMLGSSNIDPDLPVLKAWSGPLLFQAVLLLLLLSAGLASLKRLPWLGFGLVWFFIHLLPTNSLVPRYDVANDRQLYLPILGICLAAGAGLATAIKGMAGKGRLVSSGVAVVVLVIMGAFTVVRNHDYRSEVALWEATQRKSPRKARVYNNLGAAYVYAGRDEEARQAFLTALRIDADYEKARQNLAGLVRRLPAKE